MNNAFGGRYPAPDVFYKVALAVVAMLLLLSPALHPLKLMRVSAFVPALNFYIGFPLVILFLTLSWTLWCISRDVKADLIELTLVFLAVWGVAWTIWNGGSIVDIAGNLSRVLFAFLLYGLTRRYSSFWTLKTTKTFARFGFLGVVVGVLFLYGFGVFGPLPVYLGLSSESAFLMLGIALTLDSRHRWKFLFFVVAIIVLAGKRGNILAVPCMVIAYYLYFGGKPVNLKFRAILVPFGLFTFALFLVVVANTGVFALLPDALTNRFSTLSNISAGEEAIRMATAGRNIEVLAVLDQWSRSPEMFWLGAGFGAAFEVLGPDGYVSKSTVHITPVAIAFIYGFPVAVIFMFVIVRHIFKAFARELKQNNPVVRVWIIVSVGILIVSMSSFVLFQNYLFWIALAIISKTNAHSVGALTVMEHSNSIARG